MASDRINHAIQIMLQEACGLSPEEAKIHAPQPAAFSRQMRYGTW